MKDFTILEITDFPSYVAPLTYFNLATRFLAAFMVGFCLYLMYNIKFWRKGYEKLVFVDMVVIFCGRIFHILVWTMSFVDEDNSFLYYGGITAVFFKHFFIQCSMACHAGIFYVFVRVRKAPGDILKTYQNAYKCVALLFFYFLVANMAVFVLADVVIFSTGIGVDYGYTDHELATICKYIFMVNYALPFVISLKFLRSLAYGENVVGSSISFERMTKVYGYLSLFWGIFSLPFVVATFIEDSTKQDRISTGITFSILNYLPIVESAIVFWLILWDRYKSRDISAIPTTSCPVEMPIVIVQHHDTVVQDLPETPNIKDFGDSDPVVNGQFDERFGDLSHDVDGQFGDSCRKMHGQLGVQFRDYSGPDIDGQFRFRENSGPDVDGQFDAQFGDSDPNVDGHFRFRDCGPDVDGQGDGQVDGQVGGQVDGQVDGSGDSGPNVGGQFDSDSRNSSSNSGGDEEGLPPIDSR